MKHVKKYNINKVAFFDIETAAQYPSYHDMPEAGQKAWQYKMRNEGVVPDEKELNEVYVRSAALYSEFNKIVAYGVGYLTPQNQLRVKTFSSEDESEVVNSLFEVFTQLGDNSFRLCGHAAMYFDYPTTVKRALANGIKLPQILELGDKKPWEVDGFILDTNVLYKGFGTSPGSSLIALCYHLDIPTPKVDIDGSQVSEYYHNGKLDVIEKYVGHDVVATFNVFRRLRYEDIILYEDCAVNEEIPESGDNEISSKEILFVSKIKGKKQLYNVQLDDNEDYIVFSKTPPKPGINVVLSFNEAKEYYEIKV